jgi:hypothetical protein
MPGRTDLRELKPLPLTAGVGLLAGFLIGWCIGKRKAHPPKCPAPYAPKIPDRFDETELASTLAARLAGTPADGSTHVLANPAAVIWVDRGDEVLVHLESVRTQIRDRMLLVSVDLETDQHGRTPLVMACAMGNADDPAGLNALTDELPHGNGALASRWGKTMRQAVWASLMGLAVDHAGERFAAPMGISASPGLLRLHAGAAPSATTKPSSGAQA